MGLTVFKPFQARPVLFTGALLWLTMIAPAQADEPKPERAQDLRYGWALYEYHQGNAFEALTQLAVAREQGGIGGHGDHPELIEGGLMLSWGMTREASRLFTELLGADGAGSTLSPDVRNQAWFYLGKVFYLQGDHGLASENLERVDGDILAEANHDLFREWIYLRVRLAMMSSRPGDGSELASLRAQLEDTDIWSLYLQYNSAVSALAAGDAVTAGAELQALIAIIEQSTDSDEPEAEREGLLDRARLSLARLYLRDNQFDAALEVLDLLERSDHASNGTQEPEHRRNARNAGEQVRALFQLEGLIAPLRLNGVLDLRDGAAQPLQTRPKNFQARLRRARQSQNSAEMKSRLIRPRLCQFTITITATA